MQQPVVQPAGRGFGCLSVWLWRLRSSARWEARSACPSARRAATQMAATKASAQMGAPEAAMWAVSLTQAAAMRVEAAKRSRTL